MSRRITSTVEHFIRDEIAERVDKERKAIKAEISSIEAKVDAITDEIDDLECQDEDEPADWDKVAKEVKKLAKKEFDEALKKIVAKVKAALDKKGYKLEISDSDYAEYLAEEEGTVHLDFFDDVFYKKAPETNEKKIKALRKEQEALQNAWDKADAKRDALDRRIDKATAKVILNLTLNKDMNEVDSLIKSVKI